LRERGYVEGGNIVVEWRYSEGRDVVRLKVDLIVTVSNPGARAAKKAATTIPIVMGNSLSPERIGLVASLARPEGNVAGR